MSPRLTVSEIAEAVSEMSGEERQNLLLRLAQIDEVLEDLEDIADIVRSRNEPQRPFADILQDMRAEGRDV